MSTRSYLCFCGVAFLASQGCAAGSSPSTASADEPVAASAPPPDDIGHIGAGSPGASTRVGGTMAAPAVHPATAAEQVQRERAGQAPPPGVTGEQVVEHRPGESSALVAPTLRSRPTAISDCVVDFSRRAAADARGRLQITLALREDGGVAKAEVVNDGGDAQLVECVQRAALEYRYEPLGPQHARQITEVLEFDAQ